ncbi:natterin-4-like [Aulostomus maculatus]
MENQEKFPKVHPNASAEALPLTPEIESELNHSPSAEFNGTDLEWQAWTGSLPEGAVSIYNGYAGHFDYVCKFFCESGFYSPEKGPFCYFPHGQFVYATPTFDILVDKDYFEFLQWTDGVCGGVSTYAIQTCTGEEKYVGKNRYGLGKVDVDRKGFILSLGKEAYWYSHYKVLEANKDVRSEHLLDVVYDSEGAEVEKLPPEILHRTSVSNYGADPVTSNVTISKTTQVEHAWRTDFSVGSGLSTSISTVVPQISSAGIDLSGDEVTLVFTDDDTYIESVYHSDSSMITVPPLSSCDVFLVGTRYKDDLPYKARLSRTYINRESTWTSISGMYSSAQVRDVHSEVQCQPLKTE